MSIVEIVIKLLDSVKAMVKFEPEWIDSYGKCEFKSGISGGLSDDRTTPVTVKNGS